MITKTEDNIRRLEEIQAEILVLLEESEFIIAETGNDDILKIAREYWILHVKRSLLKDPEYLAMITMEDTISEIKNFIR